MKISEKTNTKELRRKFNEIFKMVNKNNSLDFLTQYTPAGVFKKQFYKDIELRLSSSKDAAYTELTSLTYLITLLDSEPIDSSGASILDFIVKKAADYQALVKDIIGDKEWLFIENVIKKENMTAIDYIAAITLYLNQA